MRPLLVTVLMAAALPLSACTANPAPTAQVVVQVEPSADPEAYDVHLAQQDAGFRERFALRPGQARSVTVPAGWVTVRVAGLCVVPTRTAARTVVEVGASGDCRVL